MSSGGSRIDDAYDRDARDHSNGQNIAPIDQWSNANNWTDGEKMQMINPCLRNDWVWLLGCSDVQKRVATMLQMYAASRPRGTEAFTCYFRHKISVAETQALAQKGTVITAWQNQLVSASPPTSDNCLAELPATRAITGKCYRVDVPKDSTFVVLDPSFELLFPIGCRFTVLQTETPGLPIHVKLDQRQVVHTPGAYPFKRIVTYKLPLFIDAAF